jgi:hypothetical protein
MARQRRHRSRFTLKTNTIRKRAREITSTKHLQHSSSKPKVHGKWEQLLRCPTANEPFSSFTPTNSQGSSAAKSTDLVQNTPVGGWLSRTYITGLILPGESLTHLLVSTLLENDSSAIAALGDSACLYGGIVYRNQSWWSKHSIVGRVLAVLPGSKECMDWIFVPQTPKGAEDGWYDIQSAVLRAPKTPRIKDKEAVGSDAVFLGGKSLEDSLLDHFVIPTDSPDSLPSSAGISFDSVYLKPGVISTSDSSLSPMKMPPSDPSRHLAWIHFTSTDAAAQASSEAKEPDLHIPLLYLVQFVSAYPCFPPSASKLKMLRRDEGRPGGSDSVGGHPLHISQGFRIIQARELLLPTASADKILGDTSDEEEDPRKKEVLIIDARHDATLELLARAWCAWKGEHAVIGRVKVTCLACCIREARALAVKVIIRVG